MFYDPRCCVVLCCVVLCCAVLCCVVLCCIVLYCVVLYCVVLYCIVLYITLCCCGMDVCYANLSITHCRILDFGGFDSSSKQNIDLQGWNSHVHREFPGSFEYTRLVSNSAPTWSSRCCFTDCRFQIGKALGRNAIRIKPE